MAVPVKTGAKIDVGAPQPLFKMNVSPVGRQFAVSADGQRFLVNEVLSQSSADQVTVVLNWAAEMRK